MNKFFGFRGQIILAVVLLFGAFSLGLFARPGFDLVSEIVVGIMNPEPKYVTQKSDFEKEVDNYFKSQSHQARCMAMATEQVAVDWAGKFLDIAKTEGKRVEAYEIKAVNQITDETAAETVRIEKANGR